jgi:terminase small subunit / prophage DNA-packing protein
MLKRTTRPTNRRGGRPAGTTTARETERTRYYAALSDRQELANAKTRGELVDGAQVKRDTFTLFRTLRDRILAVPGRIGAELVGLDQGALEIRLEVALTDALAAFATDEAPTGPQGAAR